MQEPHVEVNGISTYINGGVPLINQEKIVLLQNNTTTACFQIANEDHTLGNMLRYIIMKNPRVEFCGYSIPHPSEYVMNLRIQTVDGYSAAEALACGIKDLCDLLGHLKSVAKQQFSSQQL